MGSENLQIASIPMPYKLNTMDPPGMLTPTETPDIRNMWKEGRTLVKRRGYQSIAAHTTTTYLYLASVVQIGTRAALFLQKTGTTGFYVPTQVNAYRAAEEGTAQQLTSINSTHETVVYSMTPSGGSNTETIATSGSLYGFQAQTVPIDGGVYYKDHYWTISNGAAGTSYISRFSHAYTYIPNTTLTATCTTGTTTVSYTALSPASTVLTGAIFVGAGSNASASYKIISQSVATTTTGTFEIESPLREASLAAAGLQATVRYDNAYGATTSTLANWEVFSTSFKVQTGSLNCVALYRDRLFVGTQNGYILWSQPGILDAPLTTNWIKTPLTCITGMIEYDNALYIFGTDRFIKLSGYDEASFSLSRTISSIGCVEHAALTVFNGNLYIPTENGLFKYNGSGEPIPITESIKNFWVEAFRGSLQNGEDHSLLTTIRITDVQDRFLLVSIFNPFLQGGNGLFADSRSVPLLMYDSFNDAWSLVTADSDFDLGGFSNSLGVNRVSRFFKTNVNDDMNFYGASARRVLRMGAAFRAPQNITQTTPYAGSNTGFETFGGTTTLGSGNQEIFSRVTIPIILDPGHTVRIHEMELEHASSKHGGTTNVFSNGIHCEVDYDSKTVITGLLPLITQDLLVPETGTAVHATYGGLHLNVGAAFRTYGEWGRILTLPIECGVALVRFDSLVSPNHTTNIALNRLHLRYETTRQFRSQD